MGESDEQVGWTNCLNESCGRVVLMSPVGELCGRVVWTSRVDQLCGQDVWTSRMDKSGGRVGVGGGPGRGAEGLTNGLEWIM